MDARLTALEREMTHQGPVRHPDFPPPGEADGLPPVDSAAAVVETVELGDEASRAITEALEREGATPAAEL